MREELKEIYNQYLLLSEETRVMEAKLAASSTLDALNKAYPDNQNNAHLILLVIKMCINADKEVSEEECSLFNKLFDTNFDLKSFKEVIFSEEDEFIKINDIIDALPEEVKFDLCLLGLIFLSADGKLTEEEVDKFEQLLA